MAGLTLRPYQEAAVTHIFERDRSLILAPVGAGKTAITLRALDEMIRERVVTRVLVLAPLRVCRNVWPAEARKWAPALTVSVALGTPLARLKAINAGASLTIINFEAIDWLVKHHLDFDAVVFDELTRLKNPSGKRFKALFKAIEHIPIRIGLTGSFTSNGLEDVFGQCKIVDQKLLGRAKGAFLQQYFHLLNPEYGDWVARKGSIEAVMERIKPATFVLPANAYQNTQLNVVPVACEMDLTPYNKMKSEMQALGVTALTAATVTSKLQQMASGFVYNSWRTPSDTPGKWINHKKPVWFSSHKFEALEDVLSENQRTNTIIVYNYEEELNELQRRYPWARTIEAADDWNAGKVPLLLVHPKSAGHGLNLQFGGCHMVFVSTPWSQELYEQTVGRIHRSGQPHDVWVYVLQTAGTIDERIWAALAEKKSVSTIALEALK